MKDRLLVSLDQVTAIEGTEIAIGLEPRGIWARMVWRNVGRGEILPEIRVNSYELPAAEEMGLLRIIAAAASMPDFKSESWDFTSPAVFLQGLGKVGARRLGEPAKSQPCPDAALGPYDEKYADPVQSCELCNRARIREEHEEGHEKCWHDDCRQAACLGWWGLCCRHGLETAQEIVEAFLALPPERNRGPC